jgi:mRNA interferase MazF
MQRGEIWFAATPGGDRPVLVLTRDPVAARIGSVVVAALTRTRRGLVSELELTTADGVPTESVVNFDNLHTIPRETFRRRVTALSPARMAEACRTLQAATGCSTGGRGQPPRSGRALRSMPLLAVNEQTERVTCWVEHDA